MRRGYDIEFVNPFQEMLDRLKLELYQARWALITLNLIPDEARKLLRSFYRCESGEQTYQWKQDVVDGIAALTKPALDDDLFDAREHAFCPLCGGGSNSPYYRGFTQEGLRRHLLGWGNRSNECDVMSSAMSLAHEHWHEKFHEAEGPRSGSSVSASRRGERPRASTARRPARSG